MAGERVAGTRDEHVVAPDSKLRTLGAVFAGWLVPGLGHVLVGRLRRGLLFGALIFGAFGFGLAHDGRLAVRDERQPFLTTLQVLANLGVGPADLVARFAVYGEAAYVMPPSLGDYGDQGRVEVFREKARSGLSIYGTAYLWTAGLMNLRLLFDVWDIGRRRSG
jgi:hypothetical protein